MRLWAPIVAFLLFSNHLLGQPIVLKVGTLIDGKGAILRKREIVIDGGKIREVRAAHGRDKVTL